MIKDLKEKSLDIITATVIAFISLFAMTFQYYSSKFVTPETPFLKIAGIPFQRLEFIAIVFVLAMSVGVLLSVFLFKEKTRKLLPICVVALGFIAMFIGMFSVDFLQTLLPTMRISHVIMTVSRLTGIMLAASGLFVGVLLYYCFKQGKKVVHALVIGLILSMFAYSLNAFNAVYIVFGVVAVLIAMLYGFIGIGDSEYICDKNSLLSIRIMDNVISFLKAGSITFLFVFGYYYFVNTIAVSPIVFAVTAITSGIIWKIFSQFTFPLYAKVLCLIIALIFFITNAIVPLVSIVLIAIFASSALTGMCSNNKASNHASLISACVGALIFAVIAMLINHLLANVIEFSANRIVYEPSVYGWLILFGILLVETVIDILLKNTKTKLTD